jgi:hypothetical protein
LRCLECFLVVLCYVAIFCFDFVDLSSCQLNLFLSKHISNELRNISASDIQPSSCLGHCIPIKNRDCVGYSMARVNNHPCCPTRSIHHQNTLVGDIEARHIECLEQNLSHLFSRFFWCQRHISHQKRVVFRIDFHEGIGVQPYLLKNVPVHHMSSHYAFKDLVTRSCRRFSKSIFAHGVFDRIVIEY